MNRLDCYSTLYANAIYFFNSPTGGPAAILGERPAPAQTEPDKCQIPKLKCQMKGFCHLTFFTRFSEICDYLDVKRKLTPHFRRQSVTRRDTNEVPPGGEEKLFDRQILKLYKSCKGA